MSDPFNKKLLPSASPSPSSPDPREDTPPVSTTEIPSPESIDTLTQSAPPSPTGPGPGSPLSLPKSARANATCAPPDSNGSQNASLVLAQMEQDFTENVVRPWMPTILPTIESPRSLFGEWACDPTLPDTPLENNVSASSFEILFLFATRGDVLTPAEVRGFFQTVGQKLDNVPLFQQASMWFKLWLGTLAGEENKRVNYVRAPHHNDNLALGSEGPQGAENKRDRLFPDEGDIVFFNPINNRPNQHFGHVALATGRQLTRQDLTDNPNDNNVHLETEILSFYGRGPGEDALIERTTIEEMLDTHSLIKRDLPQGGDQQVFFSSPPWGNETRLG